MLSLAVEYERRKAGFQNQQVAYRGNVPATWAPPELQHARLPVNVIAFTPCPTYRDVYFERVLGLRRGPSWSRYVGCAIDKLYKEIFKESRTYCQATSARAFRLYDHLTSLAEELINRSINHCCSQLRSIEPQPPPSQIDALRQALTKIVRFEAMQTASFLEFELSRVPDSTPDTVFGHYFAFTLEERLRTRHHGFTSPATPDFVLRDRIIGDVKYGPWRDFFEFSMVAYALAYEEHHQQPIDLGSVLQVEVPDSRPFPTHFESRIETLDDFKRKRFLAVRDRKLQIVAERIDPGRAAAQDLCDPQCDFYQRCWETQDGQPASS